MASSNIQDSESKNSAEANPSVSNDIEIFIYKGKIKNTHYFIHNVRNPEKYNTKISGEMYNLLMVKGLISDYNNNVIVFDNINGRINAIWVQNVNKGFYQVFFKQFLQQCLPGTIANVYQKDSELLTIIYDYSINKYRFYSHKIDTAIDITKITNVKSMYTIMCKTKFSDIRSNPEYQHNFKALKLLSDVATADKNM